MGYHSVLKPPVPYDCESSGTFGEPSFEALLGIVRSHIFISHIIAVIRGWPGRQGGQGMSAQASQQPHRPTKTAPDYFNVLWSTQNIHSNGNFRNVIILSTFSEEFPLAARICVVLSSPWGHWFV